MSGQALDYTILNKGKIETSRGKIDSICQKQSQGFQVDGVPDKFSFEIKLKNKAVVNVIELKPLLGDEIMIELIGEQNNVIESKSFKVTGQPVFLHQFKESSERKMTTNKLRVQIYNHSGIPSSIGLFYLLVRGDKIQEPKGGRNISKKPEKEFFEDPGYSPHKVPVASRLRDNKLVFSDRNKVKDSHRASSRNEDEEMKRVIELSKQEMEFEKPGWMTNEKREMKEDYIEQSYHMKPREYTRIDYEKYKKIFQYVNSSWVEAQRRVEIQKGIPEEERLSSAIQVRHFHNKVFCIDVAPRAKKQQLVRKCEEMGGKVKEDVCENCLLVTTKLDTEKVARAKKLKNVKILKPDFISDCQTVGAYLDERQYFFKH